MNRRAFAAGLLAALAAMALPDGAEARRRSSASATRSRKPRRARSSGARSSSDDAVSFSSCREARAAGYARMQRGDPGYAPRLDRDGDGIACE